MSAEKADPTPGVAEFVSDPFRTLGLPARFAQDEAAMHARYRELARAAHPDRFATAPPAERRAALARAVALNDAWRAVREPLHRAEAIVRLRGGDPEGAVTQEFLVDLMERRERLAEARAAGDRAVLVALAAHAQARMRDGLRGLAELLDGGGELSHAARQLAELRYWQRLLDELNEAAREVAGGQAQEAAHG